jgi:ABC-type antimicrobial peptide transport system permease subunit
VGLVSDAKYSEVKDAIPPLFYLPYRQDANIGYINFYVRSANDPRQLNSSVTATLARLDSNLPVNDLKTLEQQVRENVFLDRLISTLSSAFALLATLLAAIGLYGVLAFTVSQRTREIGVRMALGADAGRVRAMVLRQVGVITAIGGAIGLAGAIGLGRLAQSLLFEMQGTDPVVLTSAAVVLVVVALAAGYIPARRAASIDPMRALRYE